MLEYYVRVVKKMSYDKQPYTFICGNTKSCNLPFSNYISAKRCAEYEIQRTLLRTSWRDNVCLEHFSVEILSRDVPEWKIERICSGDSQGVQYEFTADKPIVCHDDPYLIRQYGFNL